MKAFSFTDSSTDNLFQLIRLSQVKKLSISLFITCVCSVITPLNAIANDSVLEIELDVPDLDTSPYFRPYIAVWLETPERDSVATLALWYQIEGRNGGESNGSKWLKDLRQWWRKTGRSADTEIDAITGATRKPGTYKIVWDGLDNVGNPVSAGEYLINFEASREDGGREYQRQSIVLGESGTFSLIGASEFGDIQITTQ